MGRGSREDSHRDNIEFTPEKAEELSKILRGQRMRKPGLEGHIAFILSDVMIPKEIHWTKEDWKDIYETLRGFKNRMMKRHYMRSGHGGDQSFG